MTKRWSMLAILIAGIVGSLFAAFAASPEAAETLVNKGGYYFTLATVVWFVFTLIKTLRVDVPTRNHTYWLIAAVALASFLLCLHERLGPKIAMDDYLLSSTAKSLAMERDVEVLTLGRNFNGYFIRADHYVDKRPWLYPFLVSAVHDLSGYRFANGFLVNIGFAIILLSLTGAFAYRIGGLPAGLFAPFLWASLPLLGQNAMGGGLDMLNLLLLFVVLLCGLYYVKRPDPSRLSLFSLATVLLSYTRYESMLFWVPVLLIIAIGWFRVRRPVLSFAFVASPALLIGLAALHRHIASNPILWELPDGLSARFSAEYLIPNFYSALYYLLNFSDELSNSVLLGFAGIPCAVLFFVGIAKSILSKSPDRFQKLVLLAISFGVLAQFLIIMAYHDGQLDEKISSRFALPLYLLFVVSIISILSENLKRTRDWGLVGAVVVIFMLGFTLPHKAKGIYSKSNFVVREAQWLEKQASELFEPMGLVVDTQVTIWTLNEWQSINPSKAVTSLARLDQERARGKFPEIYWIERSDAIYSEEEGVGFKPDFPVDGFEKTLLAERSFSPLRMTRIYKVGAIEEQGNTAPSTQGAKGSRLK